MKKILILLVLLFSTSVSSLASDENYEDCILENMKGTGSDVAAIAIKDACKAKHINTIFSICVETEAQIINGIIFLPNMTKPFTGSNLCKYVNGQVKLKGEIKDGKFDGKSTWWYESGQKGLEKNYKDGKLDGNVTWWYGYYNIRDNIITPLYNDIKLDGQIWLQEHYKDGKKDGKWTTWSESGQIWSEKHYKDGKFDGKSTMWYESGQKGLEKNYKDGKLDGKWTSWSSSGQMLSERDYKDGVCISGDC